MDALSEIKSTEQYVNEIAKDGVTVVKNMFHKKQLQLLKKEVNDIYSIVRNKIANLSRPLKKHSDITERYLGRLDFKCGFTANIFEETAQPIIQLINNFSPTIDFRHYWGAIPSVSGAGSTNMHRDVYPILNTTEGVNLGSLDVSLPPYYFTALIPLVNITLENGPTEFIKGSHRRLIVDANQEDIYAPLLSPGDIVIFDGRTLHRGAANQSADERLVAYITFAAEWYHDQTFMINHYMFPKLSVVGR